MREMKDSGVEWIGEIPVEWKIVRLKTIFSFSKGLSITKADLVETGIPVISYGQIHSKRNTGTHLDNKLLRYVPFEYLENYSDCLIKYGDIVFADTSEDLDGIGNAVLMDKSEAIFAGYHTITIRPIDTINSKYISYLIKADNWRFQLRSNASGIKVFSITQKMLKNCDIIFPPLAEQQKIAAYLDDKCTKIDSIIDKQQTIIEKLKAYKQSVITEAVTKGLNPDVKMKDSGVEWIGEIPDGWKIAKIKYNFKIISGATPRSEKMEYWNGDINWITPADFKTDDIYVSKGRKNITKSGYDSCGVSLVPNNSIIFSKRAPIGNVVISSNTLCTNQGCLACVSKKEVSIKYFYFAMSAFTEQFNLYGTGTTFKEISTKDFSNFILPLPQLNEQHQIADYLDKKCSAIDSAIEKKQAIIEKLTEYKKSLIYEVVTGKKEV